MAKHLELGEAGEALAADFLQERGFRIIARRVRCRRGELDLVAREKKIWVFVEVKTRRNDRMGTSSEAVNARKIDRLRRAIREYVYEHGLEREALRGDVVAIDFTPDGIPDIKHYPAAFTLE